MQSPADPILFLNLDQRLGSLRTLGLLGHCALKLDDLLVATINRVRFTATLFRQAGDLATVARRAPARQLANIDESMASRRSSAPSSPGFLHASASRKMRRLSSALNLRRSRFADTSVLVDASLVEASPLRSEPSTSASASFD